MSDEGTINDYVRRLGWSLQRLDPAERRALVDEVRSHLIDSAGGGPGSLERAIAGFGTPYTLGRRFVEECELAGAIGQSGPQHLLLALLGRSTRRAAATTAVFAAVLCYILTAVFTAMALAKPFVPAHVGAWRFGEGWGAGILTPAPAAPELLGLWVIPLSLALAIGCYMLGTVVLRLTGRRLLG